MSFEQLDECCFKQRKVKVVLYFYFAKVEEGCLLRTGPLWQPLVVWVYFLFTITKKKKKKFLQFFEKLKAEGWNCI